MKEDLVHHLNQLLSQPKNDSEALFLIQKYENAFPMSYYEAVSTVEIADDIVHIESLSEHNHLTSCFFQSPDHPPNQFSLKIFTNHRPSALSDVLPMIENMGLRTIKDYSHEMHLKNGEPIWISNFTVEHAQSSMVDVIKTHEIFQEGFAHVYAGHCENDGFNKLILSAQLSWREVTVIRAYAKYLHQVQFRFSQSYIENTLAAHPKITRSLVDYFQLKHDPTQAPADKETLEAIINEIQQSLTNVPSLDDDRILRRYFDLIKATLRTNYYQKDEAGQYKKSLSFKLRSADVPELPLPRPLFEIFVYSTDFEGIHLRASKIARGGIRWSDRREDFRREILGLMKAQKVKNAVIVPSGAKGGFVLKTLPPHPSRELFQKTGIACYTQFINSLLDLTDNIIKDKIVAPVDVVCYDEPDAYLVVAADKGTATFSDLANSISATYRYWLGDAFASGGSAGYDHKKMGITARGAWESVKRHFRQLDIKIGQDIITVVGIGDMSGDVFGNGLIYTEGVKLIAAFDHRHIFLDPDPDPVQSYQERLRLFNLPASSWGDYAPTLISNGGGVYPRSDKSIPLSAEIKAALGITDDALAPTDLIRAILKAPVDLLFNGGIGTYVKSSLESPADAGDKTNEFCRINGNELRCKVVGEGGNLGFTQLGRVEYALQGGLIFADFIDNSAGVDCSDHEVNIKILLNKKMELGQLTLEKRNELLIKMTDEVRDLVLRDNYLQALVMSFSAEHSAHYAGLYQEHIKILETAVGLKRTIEFLPDDKKLIEYKLAGHGLTRPELAVLLAYTKMYLKSEIINSNLPEDKFFDSMLHSEFPQTLSALYAEDLSKHYLRREIVATQLSNHIINTMGITFPFRLQASTNASMADIARAQTIVSKIYDVDYIHALIESLDNKISVKMQYELLHHVRQLLNMATRWFLLNGRLRTETSDIIKHYADNIKQLKSLIPDLIVGSTRGYLDSLNEQFVAAGLSQDLAKEIAIYRVMYTALNVTEVATLNQFDLDKTTKIYFKVGGQFGLVWFRDRIAVDNTEGSKSNMARLTLRDDLDGLQRRLTVVIIKSDLKQKDCDLLISNWIKAHGELYTRWDEVVRLTKESPDLDYTLMFIAFRELSNMMTVIETA